MNHRYHHKRAFYLAAIASFLTGKLENIKIEYECLQNDTRRPVLVLSSTEKSSLHFSKHGLKIRILPIISSSLFSPARLAPTRNNIRPHPPSQQLPPTPHYNSLILQDTSIINHLNLLHKHAHDTPAFREASILAKVWLAQRGLTEYERSGYGMSGFIFTMVMAWLMDAKKLNVGLSSYQMFKVTLDFLAHYDFDKKPLFLTDQGKAIEQPGFSAQEFLDAFDVAIVDPTGTFNLAAHLSKSALMEFQFEAKMALELFRDEKQDHFDALFLKKVHAPLLKFDNIFR